MRKPIKVGVQLGDGPVPGYRWNGLILDKAYSECRTLLNDMQADHFALQFRELALLDDPAASQEHDIKAIENFYELRDQGGVLYPLSIRVLFYIWDYCRAICVIGVFKKTTQKTPLTQKVKARKRIRQLMKGQLGDPHALLKKASIN